MPRRNRRRIRRAEAVDVDRGRGGGGVAGLADNFLFNYANAPNVRQNCSVARRNYHFPFAECSVSTGSISAAFGGSLRELCVTAFFMKFAPELKLLLTFRHISLRKIMMVGNDFWKAANKFKRRNRNRRFGNLVFKFNDLCCYDSKVFLYFPALHAILLCRSSSPKSKHSNS